MAQIDKFLNFLVKSRGSDLHLVTDSPPIVRLDGELQKMKLPPMTAEQVGSLIYEIMPDRNRKEFDVVNDTDFAYELEGKARFRTCVYRDIAGPSVAMRLIPFEVLTVEKLGLPNEVKELTQLPKGIILHTGPTGCGKSTTLAAMLDHVNKTRTDHVITIEDPVEFTHENKSCIFSHREVGTHTESFKRALRQSLRQDPDVILVGEMRDLETTALAITAAETGHLVFSTVHTSTAASSVDRIIDQFPPDRQEQIRVMLSSTLKAVITQMLCKRKGGGRVAAYEILIVHSAVSNLIREKKTYQLNSVIQTGKKYGMVSMNESLMSLVARDIVELDEAYTKSTDKQDMNERVNNWLLMRIQSGEMEPMEALRRSFFRPKMLERLKEHGYSRRLKGATLEAMDMAEERVV